MWLLMQLRGLDGTEHGWGLGLLVTSPEGLWGLKEVEEPAGL